MKLAYIFFFSDGINDPEHVNDYIRLWRAFLAQKTVLVCLKGDSKEIVGLNMNYVSSEGDTFFTDAKKLVSFVEIPNRTIG